MTTTSNMGLSLPTVGTDTNWATELNGNWSIIDGHNHTSGSGVQLNPGGLNINGAFSMANNAVTALRSAEIDPVSSAAPPIRPLWLQNVNGSLVFTDANANQVTLTANAAPVAKNTGQVSYGGVLAITSTLFSHTYTIGGDLAGAFLCNTTSHNFTWTLPNAALNNGRMLYFKDSGGDAATNTITILPPGSEKIDVTGTSLVISANYGFLGVVSDGTYWWRCS